MTDDELLEQLTQAPILFLVGGFILGYFLRGIVEKDAFGKSEEKSSEKNTISR